MKNQAVRIDTLARIETPESVWLTFRTAGISERAGAYFIDLAIRVGVSFAGGLLITLLSVGGDALQNLSAGVFLLFLFVLEWAYCVGFEWLWSGRTPGKRALGLRVMRTDGCPVTFLDAVIRNLLRAADGLPVFLVLPFYGLGALLCLVTPRQQRIGDLVAGTMVIRERGAMLEKALPSLDKSAPFAPGEIRYSYQPGPRLLATIEKLCRRSASVAPSRAQEIAKILAVPVSKRLGYSGDFSRDPLGFLKRVLVSSYGLGADSAPSDPVSAPSSTAPGETTGSSPFDGESPPPVEAGVTADALGESGVAAAPEPASSLEERPIDDAPPSSAPPREDS